jgi:hypothetical protein
MHAYQSRSLQSPPNLVSIPSVGRPGGARSSHTTPGSRHNSRLSSLGAPSAIAPHPFGQLDTPARRLALVRPSPRVPSTYLTGFDAPIAKTLGSLRSPATPKQPWRSTLRPSSALNSRCARHASSSPGQPANATATWTDTQHRTASRPQMLGYVVPSLLSTLPVSLHPKLHHPLLQLGTDLPRSRSLAALPGSTTSSSSTENAAPSRRNTRRSSVPLPRNTMRRRLAKSAA